MSVVEVQRKASIAVVTLKKEPVNSLNTELWAQFKEAFDKVEADASIKGVVFTSGLARNVFTAGNDINELYAPRTSLERYRRFWVLSNHLLAQIYASRLVTVCAIKGACPAGGCGLALCCDFRVMTEQGHIGLNEVALGIPVPLFWGRLLGTVVGNATAEKLCKSASLLPPLEALKLGMLDKVVKSEEELLPAAKEYLAQAMRFPEYGRQRTKAQFRDAFRQDWQAYAEPEAKAAWDMLCTDRVKGALEAYMKKLGGKRSKL